ncbi:hypothetical protein A9978_26585 [Pseudomonas sp. UMC65]|nr:hypothetical protein BME99_05070 [Pseudomonas protegens]MBB1616024.1 hypothetical protein [Pseudomonas sp. UMC65]MBB1620234.1 hypothetical protein [Pseudomonas sp. UME65]ROM21985.1 hypothetical protein BK644_29565 [Pseudomonas protegens]
MAVCLKSGAKVIVIRGLSTPAAGKALAYFFGSQLRLQDPGPGLPGRLVAQVLGMPAGQFSHPMAFFILVKTADCRVIFHVPLVRVPFAFERLLR